MDVLLVCGCWCSWFLGCIVKETKRQYIGKWQENKEDNMDRKIERIVKGSKTTDGAGVHLVRVLGHQTAVDFDPILMLDSFDSTRPEDYTAGFPMHPHRGIETISYVYEGKMTHRDSLGNTDTISSGEVQWMRAGSGIMHEEKLPACERLLGVQLWLNLARKNKMTDPMYLSIKNKDIREIPIGHGTLRLLAGRYLDNTGYLNDLMAFDYYDIHLDAASSFSVDTEKSRSVMLFTLVGNIRIDGQVVGEKSAVKLSPGDRVSFESLEGKVQVLFISSVALREPIAWGGPIVMNSNAELEEAFQDLDNDTFLKRKISY
jgi:redox-sensitive bicupin YhaK (pirin superfamily)